MPANKKSKTEQICELADALICNAKIAMYESKSSRGIKLRFYAATKEAQFHLMDAIHIAGLKRSKPVVIFTPIPGCPAPVAHKNSKFVYVPSP